MKFVGRLLEGEKMAELCHEFGISRKTGYKFWDRYKNVGLHGMTDRTRRPERYAAQLPMQIEKEILRIKHEKPSWGAPKRCADYKGEFMLGDRRYCYPLTITDFSSRYLLTCEALESNCGRYAFYVFERVFKDYGLPKTIRTDNGVPFASPHALFGLSKLSVWWLRLGISIERIKPGNPQKNGRHERMHLTLKREATKPAGETMSQQQETFDRFIAKFNTERPHQALGMKCLEEVYQPSPRPYRGLEEVSYPFHDRTITVTCCGRICIRGRKVNLSTVLSGQNVGVKEVSDGIWLVSFMDYNLGYFDEENQKPEPLEYPFAPEIV